MSSVPNINSAINSAQTANQNGFAQIAKSFQSIGTALQSGDVTSAQTALTAFQKALQGASGASAQTTSTQPFGKDTKANTDYQSLTSALQSGNLSTAQKAYSSLQNDLTSAASAASATGAKSAHRGHHHHRSSGATDTTDSTTATTDTSSTSPTASASTSSGVASDGTLDVLA